MNQRELFDRITNFTTFAHSVFSRFESASQSRTIELHETYRKVDILNSKQDDLIRQAIRCTEHELYRAAHVMAWSAAIDFLTEYANLDSLQAIRKVRPVWKIKDLESLKETRGEFAIIEAMKESGLIKKREQKAFQGLLSKRNECAHPSDYYPDLNQSLGYISEIIDRLCNLNDRILDVSSSGAVNRGIGKQDGV
ncbi:MAG: hypothetical protein F4039_04525 [Gammaproteobacteria bacterium]|nr:hypothetical protein [Gammaproteobacteria bacterium]MXX94610.1 hypothetical protein [Gammaproteobacteria bacterium]MYF53174.1 hypothetical protein [Gammaproteobacteria bacterium]MYK43336.1 hypothetical protein [Gammaproteobacteria bacterium]